MPCVAARQSFQRRRSSKANSSASVGAYSGCFRSTPRTQYPRCFRKVTRWCPMKPPAPVTSTFTPEPIAVMSIVSRCIQGRVKLRRAVSAQYRGNGPDQDAGVERQRPGVDVLDIELDPAFEGDVAPALHLPQTRDARPHAEPAHVRGIGDPLDVTPRQRARSDQRHVATQDVPELRQLVERRPPQEAPERRD